MALLTYKCLRHCLSRFLFVLAVSYILCLLSLLRLEQYTNQLKGAVTSSQRILHETKHGGVASRNSSTETVENSAEKPESLVATLGSRRTTYKAILLRRLKEDVADPHDMTSSKRYEFVTQSSNHLYLSKKQSHPTSHPHPFTDVPFTDSEHTKQMSIGNKDSVGADYQPMSSWSPEIQRAGVTKTVVTFKSLGDDFYVYGVYLDDRYSPDTYVRIMTLRPAQDNLQAPSGETLGDDISGEKGGNPNIWCHFQNSLVYSNSAQTSQKFLHIRAKKFITINVWAEPYEMCENHSKKFGGWIYSCLVPRHLVNETASPAVFPDVVSLSRADSRNEADKPRLQNIQLQPLRKDLKIKMSRVYSENIVVNDAIISESPFVEKKGNFADMNNLSNANSDFHLRNSTVKENSETIRKPLRTSNKVSQQNLQKPSIGVCVPPLYGAVALQKLINFIEMCNIMGADQVFLYAHDIPEILMRYLSNYTGPRPGMVNVVRWNIPVIPQTLQAAAPGSATTTSFPGKQSSDVPSAGEFEIDEPAPYHTDQTVWNHGQLLAVQHCLYSNMADYDWLLFMDIDEMLVPKEAKTWPELIQQTLKTVVSEGNTAPENLAGLSFQSAFFQQDFRSHVTNSIEYFKYLHRTQQTSFRRSKMLVRPRAVFELGIHHISKPVIVDEEKVKDIKDTSADVGDDSSVLKVLPSLALIHHYRKCLQDPDEAEGAERIRGSAWTDNGWVPLESAGGDGSSNFECNVLVKDITMLKYEAALTIISRNVTNSAMNFFAGQV